MHFVRIENTVASVSNWRNFDFTFRAFSLVNKSHTGVKACTMRYFWIKWSRQTANFKGEMKFCPLAAIKLMSQSTGHFTFKWVIQLKIRNECTLDSHCLELNAYTYQCTYISTHSKANISQLWTLTNALTMHDIHTLQLCLSTLIQKYTRARTHAAVGWVERFLYFTVTRRLIYQRNKKLLIKSNEQMILLANRESEINQNFMMIPSRVLTKQHKRMHLSFHHQFDQFYRPQILFSFWMCDKNLAFILNYCLSMIRKWTHVGQPEEGRQRERKKQANHENEPEKTEFTKKRSKTPIATIV